MTHKYVFLRVGHHKDVNVNEGPVSEDSASPGTSTHALKRHPHEPPIVKSSGADLNRVMLVPDALGQATPKYAPTLECGYSLATRSASMLCKL